MPDLIYRFGRSARHWREASVSGGQIVHLRGKIFDTLRVLVEKHDRLARKDELMKAVWFDSVVEEKNLDHNISTIRKALGQLHGG